MTAAPLFPPVGQPRVLGCDVCSAPATAMVNAPDHRFHSFRCDLHAREAVAQFAVIQARTTVEPLTQPLSRSVQ